MTCLFPILPVFRCTEVHNFQVVKFINHAFVLDTSCVLCENYLPHTINPKFTVLPSRDSCRLCVWGEVGVGVHFFCVDVHCPWHHRLKRPPPARTGSSAFAVARMGVPAGLLLGAPSCSTVVSAATPCGPHCSVGKRLDVRKRSSSFVR